MVSWWQQWSDACGVNGGMNWVDIDWIGIKTELAHYKQIFEVTISLLGFVLCLEWFYGKIKGR